ncbi:MULTISPECIES: tyrosine-type recombinase/integrase [Providencia]|uniref:Tyrosine-type recombinase/integrase n=1 Tax=Providencia manganoxydans TaxID=2923283 RepID=A0ABX7ACT8_9GAMM|nr:MULTISPECIES: tyrosine-type recombinase/integrase [Providencia]MDX4947460.1 tyrosine-type recombinase/integrase [Providencia manganoxydans]QQO61560.1 tyrosine-type recombinase/integrase [Providencia manganoxydans]
MARNRSPKNAHLPPNLYCRKGYYSYRNPETGIEYGIGRNKAEAVNEAISANYQILSEKIKPSLVERMADSGVMLYQWISEYQEILKNRDLKPKTYKSYISKLNSIKEYIPNISISLVTPQLISQLINEISKTGKISMAAQVRTTSIDLFREAIIKGILKDNPAEHTKPPKVQVSRSRMSFSDYESIKKEISAFGDFYPLLMDLALLTGQRAGDVLKIKRSDIKDGRLFITQEKTGIKIAIPLTLSMLKLRKSVNDVLISPVLDNKTEYLFINEKKNNLPYMTLFRRFSSARDNSGLKWPDKTPPSFHEIRSLSARIYSEEKNSEFAKALLGHKSMKMTAVYQDERSNDWNYISE